MTEDTYWTNIFRKKEGGEKNIFTVLSKIPIFADLNHKELRSIERIDFQ